MVGISIWAGTLTAPTEVNSQPTLWLVCLGDGEITTYTQY